MKKIMTMVSAIMMVAAANAETTKNVTPFYEVNVNVPARIRVIKGNEYDINVRTREDANSQSIKYTVDNGILRISTNDEAMMTADGKDVMITITVPNYDTNVTYGRGVMVKSIRKQPMPTDMAAM